MGHTTNLRNQLQNLSKGFPDSRNTIIEHTCERLRHMARRMLRKYPGVGRWSDTDDVLQQALIRLHRSLHVVQPESPRKYYGFAAVQIRRELIDLARSFSGPHGLGTKHDSDGGLAAKAKLDDRYEPTLIVEWSNFHTSIEQLPNPEKEVFELLFYGGLTQTETAKVLGLSLSTIKRRFQSARLLLREIYDQGLFGE